ncbi:F-box protein at2g27310-like protein [Trifolium pratense]|uniref:F-box protein at2g27310-like protein n=2 Tax=Trifolium pratense TaxID=57577 RepID=A0A2K3MVG9_TRIPR|nr:probable F-box protein At2g36090 [Trifolium pratense]XP_045790996.1 probable F-box protein At2g36090 [Trifolium pratense]XP_045791008.1 probable F-box protein At2g36090 [Trifolium pratense]PNX94752.1 F-box protein at2g27310-like protein [Trifolium pratense]CAJ2663306.1 unnamed protein product [Trifolium pratense]
MNNFSMLPPDIILTHILPRLDGETLTALSAVSSEFFHMICKDNNSRLWVNVCISTWPSLLSHTWVGFHGMIISDFPGGCRSFFSDAFPSLHHRNNPPPPPPPPKFPSVADFAYVFDVFLQGERERERELLCANIGSQSIKIGTCGATRSFRFVDSCDLWNILNFIPVKKDGCEEYLKEKLRFSCVLISSLYSEISSRSTIKHAGSLFRPCCKPVSVTTNNGSVVAVYETLLPMAGVWEYFTEMVKCEVKVKCEWKNEEEDKFYVRRIKIRMEDMDGIVVNENQAAIILMNAIENGERRGRGRGNEFHLGCTHVYGPSLCVAANKRKVETSKRDPQAMLITKLRRLWKI